MDIKILLNYVKECEYFCTEPTVEGLLKYKKKELLQQYKEMI